MQKLIIKGEKRLKGDIEIQGAKNSALPILAAAAMCDGEVILKNCPKLTDTYAALRILTYLGCSAIFQSDDERTVVIQPKGLSRYEITDTLMREMRSSIFFLGALTGKLGRCIITFPGGCAIGQRPIDMHLSALKKMGGRITDEHGRIDVKSDGRLKGAKIALSFPSVGATENIILAGVLAQGTTEINNAAREPEIIDLAEFLNKCGAKIHGAGSGKIIIHGVEKLHGCEYEIMPDRIVCATLLACTASAGGEITAKKCIPQHLDAVNAVFEQMGCIIHTTADSIHFSARKPLKSVDVVRTMVYPGFPTDCQAFIMAAMCKSEGTSIFVENIFENRFQHTSGFQRMGADIKLEGKVAVIEGVKKLYGANCNAPDLRGGAGLVACALSAEGVSEISDIHYIDRGYEAIEKTLAELGADIRRV